MVLLLAGRKQVVQNSYMEKCVMCHVFCHGIEMNSRVYVL